MDPLGVVSCLWALCTNVLQYTESSWTTVRDQRQQVKAQHRTLEAELDSLLNVLETLNSMRGEIDSLKEHCARLHRNQFIFPAERRGESDAPHATGPMSLSSEKFFQEMQTLSGKEMSQILMAAYQGHDQLNTIHGEDMATFTRGRIKSMLFQGARWESSPTECLDPEKGIGQHDLYPHRHEDDNPFEDDSQRTSEGGLHVLFELTLWCSSWASCWMMERLARPEANPSATVFVAVIWTYTGSIGTSYFIHSESRGIDLWILCGGLCGLVCGWMMDWTLVEIIFRLLPGAILFAFWLGVHWAKGRRLSGHLVE
ncbi:hypothetical protein NCS57_01269500 [Fusarium keratoplasticum]|uniref:Uncharacterized protein n=1 Tax=Fusarium keratoplasticum TaxID=1328300 RepID=A0ACC0QL69_9HYPO|nr:hypothetical protein NCS57_01269500 [Fusarium keratoplasticum]KAI8655212.1 hypothetical protein NCS57_01269500 [Fusarium keratoplasticum]